MTDEEKRKERKKETSRLRYIKNKKQLTLNRATNQSLKQYLMFGKSKIIKLPADIIAILHERFRVDETSKTGLRWSESNTNKRHLRGNEAGYTCSTTGYYNAKIIIGKVIYLFSVARVVWMMVNNRTIELGMQVDHRNRNRADNRIANLEVGPASANNVNRSVKSSRSYKNVGVHRKPKRSESKRIMFYAQFTFLRVNYIAKCHASEDAAFVLGWELLTSGEVPLKYIKAQSTEYLDGSDLKRALAECKKQGIAVTPPKFKTLYEYIASVEGSC